MNDRHYIIEFRCVNDPLFQPWDLHVKNSEYEHVLTVQPPWPDQGDNLIGFEDEPQMCELTVHDDDWQEKCIDMAPVFAGEGSMYSIPNYRVERVIDKSEVQV